MGTLNPARWLYRKHEQQPETRVAIRRGLLGDLYIVMPAFELKDQSISLQIVVNALVSWIWVGFGLLAIGGGIALLPERALSVARSRTRVAAESTSSGV